MPMFVIFTASMVLSFGALKLLRSPTSSWTEFLSNLHQETRFFSLLILPSFFVSALLFNIAVFSIVLSVSGEKAAQLSIAGITLAYAALFAFAASRYRH